MNLTILILTHVMSPNSRYRLCSLVGDGGAFEGRLLHSFRLGSGLLDLLPFNLPALVKGNRDFRCTLVLSMEQKPLYCSQQTPTLGHLHSDHVLSVPGTVGRDQMPSLALLLPNHPPFLAHLGQVRQACAQTPLVSARTFSSSRSKTQCPLSLQRWPASANGLDIKSCLHASDIA